MKCGILLFVLLPALLISLLPGGQTGSSLSGGASTVDAPRSSDYTTVHDIQDAGSSGGRPISDAAAAVSDPTPTVASVIERYIEALGGRRAIERLETRRCSGWLVTDLPSNDPPVHETLEMETYSALPNRWLLVGRDSSGTLKNGFDGEVGWDQNTYTVKPEPRMERGKLAFIINPHGPLRIGDYFHDMVLAGTTEWEGRMCYAIESDRKASSYTLYFDVETGLLRQIGYHWFLRDYREVDGVIFPFEIEVSRKGGSTTYHFEEVENNIPVDDALFAMPDATVALPGIFGGIDDGRVLPMLQHLPYTHGGMNIPSVDGRFLYDLIIERGYHRGLEIGTSNGYSTLWLGLAFRENGGSIVTLEVEPRSAEEARENFHRAGLDGVIETRICDAIEEIPRLEGEFDFVFIDAWKPDYIKYFELLRKMMSPGGAITAHNVISQDNHMRDFLEAIETDSDFETTIHHTSTEGISVSIRHR
jgi:caffeoyl-CoA O-methyltransferase